jgi:hypothetical protein
MHELPLSSEDRTTLMRIVRTQPPRERLLAELVFGQGLSLADALSARAEDVAWGSDRAKLVTRSGRNLRRTVTVDRALLDGVLEGRRQGPVFATASAVPIRADYAARVLARVAEAAGVPSGVTVKRLRGRKRAAASG